MFFKIRVLKNFAMLTGKRLCRSLFLIKLKAWWIVFFTEDLLWLPPTGQTISTGKKDCTVNRESSWKKVYIEKNKTKTKKLLLYLSLCWTKVHKNVSKFLEIFRSMIKLKIIKHMKSFFLVLRLFQKKI